MVSTHLRPSAENGAHDNPTSGVTAAPAIRSWLYRHQGDVAEILHGLLFVAWGILVAWPGSIAVSTPGLTILTMLIPETALGIIWAWVGIVQIIAAIYSRGRFRSGVALAASSLWALVAWQFALVSFGTGVVAYAALSLMEAWIFLRQELFGARYRG